MPVLYYLNVTIHVLAAFLWLGGMFFLAVVGAPALRAVEPPQLRQQLFNALGTRFRYAGWVAIGVLLVTGVVLMVSLSSYTTSSLDREQDARSRERQSWPATRRQSPVVGEGGSLCLSRRQGEYARDAPQNWYKTPRQLRPFEAAESIHTSSVEKVAEGTRAAGSLQPRPCVRRLPRARRSPWRHPCIRERTMGRLMKCSGEAQDGAAGRTEDT